MLVLSGGLAWAAVNDYSSRDIVPPGVSVAGQELSGMTAADARVLIEKTVSEPVKRPVDCCRRTARSSCSILQAR